MHGRISRLVPTHAHTHNTCSLLYRGKQEKKLDEIPVFKKLLKKFGTAEIMPWNAVEAEFGAELNSSKFFKTMEDDGKKRYDDFRKVVVEHVSVGLVGLYSYSLIVLFQDFALYLLFWSIYFFFSNYPPYLVERTFMLIDTFIFLCRTFAPLPSITLASLRSAWPNFLTFPKT